MDLEDLKQRWQDQDRTLDASLQLNRHLLHAATLGKAETAMRRLRWLLLIELIVSFLMALWLGSFIVDHVAEPHFLIPAALLHACVIGLVVGVIHQLTAIAKLDYTAPVVVLQRRMELLRIVRLRVTKLALLLSPLLWTPMLIVAAKGLLGLSVYAIADWHWLLANLLFGLAVIALAVWASRRFADRMDSSPRVQRLMRDLAGSNLKAAEGYLARLASFEEESPA